MIEDWLAVQTQWRTGMNGPTGLDYAGVEAALRLRGTAAEPDRFAALQVCEAAALVARRDKREREQLAELMRGG